MTNQRDNAFKTTIEKDYPDIKIVAEQGISDPARAEELASAMLLQHPDLAGIYVTWAEPADGVLAALRAAGNTTTKVVTLDLSEPVALDMVKGGNVIGIVADKAYELGRAMAATGMKALLGEPSPPFVVAPALTVTKENVAAGLAGVAASRRAAVGARRGQVAISAAAAIRNATVTNATPMLTATPGTAIESSRRWRAVAQLAEGTTTGPNGESADAGRQHDADPPRKRQDQGRQATPPRWSGTR